MGKDKPVSAAPGELPEGIPPGSIPSPMGSAIRGPIDWVKRVAESNGTSFFIEKDYIKRWEGIDALREDFNADAVKLAQKEITLNMTVQNFYFDLRKKLDKEGVLVWTKDIGLDAAGLKDGKYIVNLLENKRG